MEQQLIELLEKVNTLVGQTGGEAARLWPTLVRHFYLTTIMKTITAGVLALVAGTVSGVMAAVAYKAREGSDMRGGSTAVTIATGILFLVFVGLAVNQLPNVLYPEAAYVKSIVRQL